MGKKRRTRRPKAKRAKRGRDLGVQESSTPFSQPFGSPLGSFATTEPAPGPESFLMAGAPDVTRASWMGELARRWHTELAFVGSSTPMTLERLEALVERFARQKLEALAEPNGKTVNPNWLGFSMFDFADAINGWLAKVKATPELRESTVRSEELLRDLIDARIHELQAAIGQVPPQPAVQQQGPPPFRATPLSNVDWQAPSIDDVRRRFVLMIGVGQSPIAMLDTVEGDCWVYRNRDWVRL